MGDEPECGRVLPMKERCPHARWKMFGHCKTIEDAKVEWCDVDERQAKVCAQVGDLSLVLEKINRELHCVDRKVRRSSKRQVFIFSLSSRILSSAARKTYFSCLLVLLLARCRFGFVLSFFHDWQSILSTWKKAGGLSHQTLTYHASSVNRTPSHVTFSRVCRHSG